MLKRTSAGASRAIVTQEIDRLISDLSAACEACRTRDCASRVELEGALSTARMLKHQLKVIPSEGRDYQRMFEIVLLVLEMLATLHSLISFYSYGGILHDDGILDKALANSTRAITTATCGGN